MPQRKTGHLGGSGNIQKHLDSGLRARFGLSKHSVSSVRPSTLHLVCQSSVMADGLLQADTMGHERLRKLTADPAIVNVEVEGVPYHGPYNPRREAAKFYGAYSIEKLLLFFSLAESQILR